MSNAALEVIELEKVLQRHFADITPELARQHASKLRTSSGAASDIEWLERHDRSPERDRTDLRKAAKNLKLAARQLNETGWYGRNAIHDVAVEIYRRKHEISFQPSLSRKKAVSSLVETMMELADIMDERALGIDLGGAPFLSAFGNDDAEFKSRGGPTKTHAAFVAREVFNVSLLLTGRHPTHYTDRTGFETQGTFAPLLSDVYRVLNIDASPEVYAKLVLAERNRK